MILSKDELRERGKPREETVVITSLGPDAEVTVRGYTVADRATITDASVTYDSEGKPHLNRKQDKLLSVMACLVEPKISLEDTGWVQNLAADAIDEILYHADRLTSRTEQAYSELVGLFKLNPLARRLWTVCVEKLGRFPMELSGIGEEEFMKYLAAAEVEADLAEAEAEKAIKEAKQGA